MAVRATKPANWDRPRRLVRVVSSASLALLALLALLGGSPKVPPTTTHDVMMRTMSGEQMEKRDTSFAASESSSSGTS